MVFAIYTSTCFEFIDTFTGILDLADTSYSSETKLWGRRIFWTLVDFLESVDHYSLPAFKTKFKSVLSSLIG